MSDEKPIVSAVRAGAAATQSISVEILDDTVFLTETRFSPGENSDSGDFGWCRETVICFEVGAIDAVIRELRKIKKASR